MPLVLQAFEQYRELVLADSRYDDILLADILETHTELHENGIAGVKAEARRQAIEFIQIDQCEAGQGITVLCTPQDLVQILEEARLGSLPYNRVFDCA